MEHRSPIRLPRAAAIRAAALAAALAAVATALPAVTVTVGSGADCDFADLQSALDAVAGAPEATVRVAAGQLRHVAVDFFPVGSVAVEGGFATCSSVQSTGTSDLLGDFSTGPVLAVHAGPASHVTLRHLLVSQGGGTSAGGGLRLTGGLTVTLDGVHVNGNSAAVGGGISLVGGRLVLETSLVSSNIATGDGIPSAAGGGIHCSGGGTVELQRSSSVLGNSAAGGFGGGMFLRDGCLLAATSDRFDTPTSVKFNRAALGGGIWADSGAKVLLAGDDHTPVVVAGNRAEPEGSTLNAGGGVALAGAETSFVARNAQIVDNVVTAGQGGGLAVFGAALAVVERTLGTDGCHTPDRCSRIGGNEAGEGAAAMVFGVGSRLEIHGTYVESNLGGDSTLLADTDSSLAVTSSILGENVTARLVALDGRAAGRFTYATVAANELTGSEVFAVTGDASLDVLSTIVFEPGQDVLAAAGAGPVSVDCLLVHETTSLPAGRHIVFGTPAFVGAPEDYHLSAVSPAIDFCDDTVAGGGFDVDRGLRAVDDAKADRFAGAVFDVGADEVGADGPLFADGFEAGSVAAWDTSSI